MKRVAVVGCPGAGKTTFSTMLAKKTGLPVIHLDYYYHQLKYDYKNNKPAWISQVNEFAGQPEWIMDGNYKSSFSNRFKRADTVVFLDYPRRLSLFRVFKRHWRYRNSKRHDMPDDWTEKISWEFLRYVWSYNNKPKDILLTNLREHTGKNIIVFKNSADATAYLEQLD